MPQRDATIRLSKAEVEKIIQEHLIITGEINQEKEFIHDMFMDSNNVTVCLEDVPKELPF
jgi:hypothetical protein